MEEWTGLQLERGGFDLMSLILLVTLPHGVQRTFRGLAFQADVGRDRSRDPKNGLPFDNVPGGDKNAFPNVECAADFLRPISGFHGHVGHGAGEPLIDCAPTGIGRDFVHAKVQTNISGAASRGARSLPVRSFG